MSWITDSTLAWVKNLDPEFVNRYERALAIIRGEPPPSEIVPLTTEEIMAQRRAILQKRQEEELRKGTSDDK